MTTGTIESTPLDMDMARLFLGGRGLGARLLWDLVGPEVEPLSPENVLIFASGPLTASGAQTSNRFSVSTKSPLTGTVLDANSGGWWGMQFKRTGYGGRSWATELCRRGFVVIAIDMFYWGERRLLQAEDPESWHDRERMTDEEVMAFNRRNVLCIGPAGENLSRMAAIMNDRERALARGGPGAVMGSKNLKAMVVAGKHKNQPVDPERFKFMLYETGKLIKASPITSQALPEFGTSVVMNVVNEIGALPTRNFLESQFEQAGQISGEAITDSILVKNQACWACPISCTRISKTEAGEGEGPEYETAWSFGAMCGVADLEAIFEANLACNDMGLDTISVGSTIACAMEIAGRGLIDTDLHFGRADLLAETVRNIAYRRELGDQMAEGSYRFAEQYGLSELSMSSKKLEIPAYDPRGMQGQGLLFATSNRGACHMRGNMLGPEVLALPRLIDRFANQGKAGIVANHQNTSAVIDSLVLCKFTSMAVSVEFFARLLTAVSGMEFSSDDLMKVGERTWNMERLYNLRAGFSKADDSLPPRLLNEPIAAGPSKGHTVRLEDMLTEYYQFRGWSPEGVPGSRKLKELHLEAFDGH
ncbi:MAG: aldehyde ferredoxin oxidoreductase family protein [Syntrophales bacterium]|nr:aldehyde ferredoxin oxidoreductase family protein [Syntrophales bacterium]